MEGDSTYEFPVVGVGASAGGLESLEELFAQVPRDSGMAFVVVQHLSPDFKSVMDELLARRTDIPIRQARDGLPVAANTIFLIPPKKEAILANARFRLRDKDPKELTLPIDHFFRSLAQEAGSRAVAVVLSGSGSDGSRGVVDVHQAGGFVIAESEETAKFDSMPMSARETGLVDCVLKPPEIPAAIIKHTSSGVGAETSAEKEPAIEGGELIFDLLHSAYGIDFSHYKAGTVGRRIERRLVLHQCNSINDYAERLREDPAELNSLYRDLLIGVTRFFRDPEAFEFLERKVIPDVIDRVDPDDEIRIWSAACATGEEAYSIAILFHEELQKRQRPQNFKIFATDIHPTSLQIASTGEYHDDARKQMTDERLARYFTRSAHGYTIDQELRKSIVFAPHNVMKDAPFTKLDMISCRNLLIYFRPPAQKKALSLFHFGLKTGGILLLGPSETPGELMDEFDSVAEHWKVYRKRRDVRLPADLRYPLLRTATTPSTQLVPAASVIPQVRGLPNPALVGAYDWALAKYMPPSILINERHELLHLFGDADHFLRVRSGRPSADALGMLDGDLRSVVIGAVQRVRKDQTSVRYSGVQIGNAANRGSYNVRVEIVDNPRATGQQFLISIEKDSQTDDERDLLDEPQTERADSQQISYNRIEALENELLFTKENLQATVEEVETANEELQATNEELVASNEELQSTNEELHSVNEELYTVNAEYQKKIKDLTEMTADMDSLMESTDVATVFLDRDLCVRKFTPQIASVFHLVPHDIGRRISSFSHHIDQPHLLDDMQRVLETGKPVEDEIQDPNGRWLYMRVLPYRPKQEIEGVVLTLVDVDTLKQSQEKLAAALQSRERFLAMLSHELRNPVNAVVSASHLLQTAKGNPATLAETVAVIQRQSGHVARLLDDLLDVSRITQHRLELRRKDIDLRVPVREAVETMKSVVAQREQTLKVDIPDTPQPVHGDADRLLQVVANLVGNAAKYSSPGGLIELTVRNENHQAVIRVKDYGDGISRRMQERIFDPFVQSNRTKDRREGGMGIGLALVKYVSERHGGSASVHSDGVGKGCEFTVRIPLLSSDKSAVPVPRAFVPEVVAPAETGTREATGPLHVFRPPTGRLKRVAIVEDQKDNRRMLKALLEMDGFEVLTAKNGRKGLEVILESRPDAALLDLGLPELNGYQVARRIREELGDDIYLIAVTGHGQSTDVDSAREAGFDNHMVKPLDLDRLAALLAAGQDNDHRQKEDTA